MSSRSAKRGKRTLEARIRDFQAIRDAKGYRKPGSRNPRKCGSAVASVGRRRR